MQYKKKNVKVYFGTRIQYRTTKMEKQIYYANKIKMTKYVTCILQRKKKHDLELTNLYTNRIWSSS